jgi:Protein of unknown function (DUF1488)
MSSSPYSSSTLSENPLRQCGRVGVVKSRLPVEFEYYFFWSLATQSIRFYAVDRGIRIGCTVTRTALEELVGSLEPLRPAELEGIFEQHRQAIEIIATRKIVAGQFQPDATILVRAVDLNP